MKLVLLTIAAWMVISMLLALALGRLFIWAASSDRRKRAKGIAFGSAGPVGSQPRIPTRI